MRFQDAAQDARAITYAAIQAEPVVAQAAGLLADATPGQLVLARAVMNGETLDPDGWRTMFPTLFGPTVEPSEASALRGHPVGVAGHRRPRRPDAQPAARRTGRIADRGAARATGRRHGCPPRAAHPVRRRARRDPPLRRDRRALRVRPRPTTASGALAVSTRTCSTSWRMRARTPRPRSKCCAWPSSCSTPSSRAASASSDRPRRTIGPAS